MWVIVILGFFGVWGSLVIFSEATQVHEKLLSLFVLLLSVFMIVVPTLTYAGFFNN